MAKTKKHVTLSEFKAWLEGVEELQERTWSPDAKQWKLIRAKIANIKEGAPPTPNVARPRADGARTPAGAPGMPPGVAAPPAMASSIPASAVGVQPTANTSPGMEVKTNANGDKVLKTPDSDGEYKTQFS